MNTCILLKNIIKTSTWDKDNLKFWATLLKKYKYKELHQQALVEDFQTTL
jgi:hypothetical protein